MPRVGITAVDLLQGCGSGNVPLREIVEQILTGAHLPDSPGSDYLELRRKGCHSALEADLIIALAGAAVGNSLHAFLEGLVNEGLGDDRTCHCGAEKVGSLVYSAGLEGRVYVVLDELFLEVLDDAL